MQAVEDALPAFCRQSGVSEEAIAARLQQRDADLEQFKHEAAAFRLGLEVRRVYKRGQCMLTGATSKPRAQEKQARGNNSVYTAHQQHAALTAQAHMQ